MLGMAPAAAQAHAATGRDSGISGAERRAITVKSLSAVGDGTLGLVLTATFAGDVERYLGQGQLAHAALSLALVPASAPQPVTGLLDVGGGERQEPVPVISGRGRGVRAGSVIVVSPDTVLRTAQAQPIEVLRDGDQVIFYLPAADLTHVAELALEVFATSPIGSRSLGSDGWREVLAAKPTSRASLPMPASLTCERIESILDRRADISAPDLEPELEQARQLGAELRSAIDGLGKVAHLLGRAPALRGVSKGALEHDLSDTEARIRRLESENAGVGGVNAALGVLFRDCASPPASTTTPTTTTPTAPTPTTPTTPTTPGAAVAVTQTDSSLSQDMAAQPALAFSTQAPTGVPLITINDQLQYQQFRGLGAAMTDSSAWLIYDNLSPASRATVMQDLFSSAGIDLNFLRVPMGASDFTVSADPYTYDDVAAGDTDPDLAGFSIAHDVPYIIPTIQQALQINPDLEISANPWSPPAWMKANDSLDNVDLAGTLLTSSYESLAQYFVKFIEAYESDGIPIDIIVPQNEPRSPGGSGTSYPGLTLPEADEETFIADDLQPALAAAGLNPEIYGNDLSWDKFSYAEPLAQSLAGTADLSGIAWHCYAGTPTVMSTLEQAYPELDQIVDECSPEIRSFGAPEYLISALRNWASVASVWNVALDPEGGPKQADNGCPGCIGLVTINESPAETYTFNTEYYQLGQVSEFVEPGAVRVDSPNFVTYGTNSSNIETVTPGLDDVAFQNPDGSQVLVAYNNSTAAIPFAVDWNGSYFSYTIPVGAMTTFTWP